MKDYRGQWWKPADEAEPQPAPAAPLTPEEANRQHFARMSW